jgi:hypothetical protein
MERYGGGSRFKRVSNIRGARKGGNGRTGRARWAQLRQLGASETRRQIQIRSGRTNWSEEESLGWAIMGNTSEGMQYQRHLIDCAAHGKMPASVSARCSREASLLRPGRLESKDCRGEPIEPTEPMRSCSIPLSSDVDCMAGDVQSTLYIAAGSTSESRWESL